MLMCATMLPTRHRVSTSNCWHFTFGAMLS